MANQVSEELVLIYGETACGQVESEQICAMRVSIWAVSSRNGP